MIEQARAKGGLRTLCASAQALAATSDWSCDRLFLKEVVHHIPQAELQAAISDLSKKLPPGGRITIVTRPHSSRHYPFFEAAHRAWAEQQPPSDVFSAMMTNAGMSVAVDTQEFTVRMKTSEWLNMIRSRFWSTFSRMTDDELNHGVAQLESALGGKPDLEFQDKLVFVTGEKHDPHADSHDAHEKHNDGLAKSSKELEGRKDESS